MPTYVLLSRYTERNIKQSPSRVDACAGARTYQRCAGRPASRGDSQGHDRERSLQYAGDAASDDPTGEVDILARIEKNLRQAPLAGFMGEGLAPYGVMHVAVDAALRRAVFSGMPVVKVGRGNADGFTARIPPFLSGTNLTATKARLLLMACL